MEATTICCFQYDLIALDSALREFVADSSRGIGVIWAIALTGTDLFNQRPAPEIYLLV